MTEYKINSKGKCFSKYRLRIADTYMILNNATTIYYKDIKNAFVGSFNFIKSNENLYNLPLSPFKIEALDFYFKEKKRKGYPTNSFIVLHVGNQLFFIKGSFFNEEPFNKVIDVLKEKDVPLVEEFPTIQEKAV